jgi:hypothetical protein
MTGRGCTGVPGTPLLECLTLDLHQKVTFLILFTLASAMLQKSGSATFSFFATARGVPRTRVHPSEGAAP